MSKGNTTGMKLLIGGEEVSEDYIEKSIIEYNKKINSPAYKKELEHFAEFMKRSITENTNPCEYYKLTFPPHTIFKLDRKNASSYKYDDFRKVAIWGNHLPGDSRPQEQNPSKVVYLNMNINQAIETKRVELMNRCNGMPVRYMVYTSQLD